MKLFFAVDNWRNEFQLAVAIFAWLAVFGFLVLPLSRMAAQDGEEPAESEAPSSAEQIAPPAAGDEAGELSAAPLQEIAQDEEYAPEPSQEPGQEEVQEEQNGDEPEAPSENTAENKGQEPEKSKGAEQDNASTTAPLIVADSKTTSIIDESAEVAGEQGETESEAPREEINIKKLKERIKYKQFKKDQTPEFVFSNLEDRRNFFKKGLSWITGKKRQTRIELIEPDGAISDADVFIDGQEVKINRKNNRQFCPGLYKIKAIVAEGDNTTEEVREFEWGVLTVNTDKSIYRPGDIANLYFGVLDSGGHTICDAAINIKITDPDGNVSYLGGNPGGECGADNITDVPDYWATYQTTIPGKYEMEIVADNGNGAKMITDSFEVRENPEFDITRIGPTRINPIAPYTMTLTIVPDEGYAGAVIESVPADFEILSTNGGNNASTTIEIIGNEKQITWQANWQAGQTYQLQYRFQAPKISPYIFLLGPLTLNDFSETRQWQIASDSPNWLSGFTYRKQINITGSAGAGTNYQVKLLVGETSGASGEQFDLAGGCTSFPNDIKFTDDDGLTELSYWVESTTGTTPNRLATVWVKVADNLDSNQSIYIYYGKSGQASTSDGDNTFLFF